MEGKHMDVVVTGFDPFGGEPLNPAWEAVKQLDGLVIAGNRVHAVQIPTVRFKAIAGVQEAIRKYDPDVVLCVGQAGGRMDLTVERVGINCDDFRIADNEGNRPVDEPIVPGGPAAYFVTLPIKKIVAALTAHGIPAKVSNTAGTFVCNHVLYGLLDILARDAKKRRGGFIHVPYLPEQAARLKNQPSMALATIVEGLKLAVEVAVTSREDAKVTGGTIC